MQSVIDIINEVCADICDHYCKYTANIGEYTQAEVDDHCRTCPLNRLAQEKPQEKPQKKNYIRPEDVGLLVNENGIPPICMNCGLTIEPGGGMNNIEVAEARRKKYGMPLCQRCANKARERQKAVTEAFGTTGGNGNG